MKGAFYILRAKKRSSDSTATALTRRIDTGDTRFWLVGTKGGMGMGGEGGGRGGTVEEVAEAEEYHVWTGAC